MPTVDYSHLIEVYRKLSNGLDLVYESVQQDYGYYCGPAKTAEEKARQHALAVGADQLEHWRATPGMYTVMVYRVPADAQLPVRKEHRKLVVAVNIQWTGVSTKEVSSG